MSRHYTISPAVLAQRKLAGSASSRKKARTAKRNGKLGGRTKKD